MENTEEAHLGYLRSLCHACCNPCLDEEFRAEIQDRVILELNGMAIPLLERLAMYEEDEHLRRAAGQIYACKLAEDVKMPPDERANKLNALISKDGTPKEVRHYVKGELSHLLGWPMEKWKILADAGKPEAERISASQDLILYCRKNEYRAALHRIAGDEGMPMQARRMAAFAMLEVLSDGTGDCEPALKETADETVKRILGERRPEPCGDIKKTRSNLLKTRGWDNPVKVEWRKRVHEVTPAAERLVRANLFAKVFK